MLIALDAPTEALDDPERAFVAKVRKHGWFDTAVFGDAEGPGFSFTTGLWVNTGQPELIMFGMKREIAHVEQTEARILDIIKVQCQPPK